jgi:single-strand DNA-binding protein
MKDVNKVILLGRLGADPVARQTKAGVTVTHFSLATSRRVYRGESGVAQGAEVSELNAESAFLPDRSQTEWKEETQWHQIVAWGKQALACVQYLKKGHRVYVEGSIRSHSWQTAEGTQKYSFEVHSDSVSFLTTPNEIQRVGLPQGREVEVSSA